MLRKRSYLVKKRSSQLLGLESSNGKIIIPVSETSVVEIEISVTGLARTHLNFNKGNRSEVRSQYQPGLIPFVIIARLQRSWSTVVLRR